MCVYVAYNENTTTVVGCMYVCGGLGVIVLDVYVISIIIQRELISTING